MIYGDVSETFLAVAVLPPPQLPTDINNTGDFYGQSQIKSEKITITATHYARTQEALAQIYTHVRQSGGCQPLSDNDLRRVLQTYVLDAACFVYTCRRLIDLSLIAGMEDRT